MQEGVNRSKNKPKTIDQDTGHAAVPKGLKERWGAKRRIRNIPVKLIVDLLRV